MPQLNKGGKFVFGLSVIHENRSVQIPPQAINEYRLSNENKIIIFTGSKITGGFCVTSYPLLSSSKLSHINREFCVVLSSLKTCNNSFFSSIESCKNLSLHSAANPFSSK